MSFNYMVTPIKDLAPSTGSTGDKTSKAEFARSISCVTQNVDKERVNKRNVLSRPDIPTKIKPCLSPQDRQATKSVHVQHQELKSYTHTLPVPQTNSNSLAASRLDRLAQNSKTNSIGKFIGRIFAHAMIDSISDESFNITGINNKLLKSLAEYAILGEIDSQAKGRDDYYQSLSKNKRFVYRKVYQYIKSSLSQPSNSNEPIKGWKSKKLHKVTAGIKNSILDQPEIKNVRFKEMVSSQFNKKADTFVEKSSSKIDEDYTKSKRHKLGYAITAGFISVLRVRTPGALANIERVNKVFDTCDPVIDVYDAMTTAQQTVTPAKLNTAFTNSFGNPLDGITETLSTTAKAVSDATNEVSFNKFLTAINNYWFSDQEGGKAK
ncbi:hypothetical protein F0225_11620 [Vibrio pectenicida]|uniref:Uncharacterized protein n=1 Tax=Vibrio pectenicida TaxID=62763 RepID=A0A7Y3ZZI4_9VIBR|nr:hypothetical protein [Vibrio pectenicida]NOH71980.1 hypothetical protein [Vibrio pectenicida]